jgi:hypothetical protein
MNFIFTDMVFLDGEAVYSTNQQDSFYPMVTSLPYKKAVIGREMMPEV